ncbi:hypothetical protein GCM10009712_26160 [Pseudarthrobacter sulfonivorans]
MAGCEYSYNDGWRPALGEGASGGPPVMVSSTPYDPWQRDPVGEADMEAWLQESQLGDGLQVAHRAYGLLRAGEVSTEIRAALPVGTYILALACRGPEPVTFQVSGDSVTMVDVDLRCGPRLQNVIRLSKETALTFRVEAKSEANYAYRLLLL